VKTRSDLASAGEAITARQRARIARAAEVFLQRRPDFSQLSVRFDVILIARRRLPRHLMDAWRPGDRF
jgi:putative endonuclease